MKIKKVRVAVKDNVGDKHFEIGFVADVENDESVNQVVDKLKERCNFYLKKWLKEAKEKWEEEQKEAQKQRPHIGIQPVPSTGTWIQPITQTPVWTTPKTTSSLTSSQTAQSYNFAGIKPKKSKAKFTLQQQK